MTDRSIACTLAPAQLATRPDTLLPGLVRRAEACEPLPDGLRWRFAPSDELLRALAATIEAERPCCRFPAFQLGVVADGGPVWLAVTGPAGTREFLEALTRGGGPGAEA